MPRFSPTERIGVSAVDNIVSSELRWIFREQPIADMGIDAHVERVDDQPTGKLIALQIKTGVSHFKMKADRLIYYGNLEHLNYWTSHALPVVLVAHLPEKKETYWVHITESAVTRTPKRWKIEILKANKFGERTKDALSNTFEGSDADQRMRKLFIDLPLMRHIQKGGKVSLELERWVNKSLGRSPVRVFIHDDNGDEILSQDWFVHYLGYGIKELAEALFPWASASVDQDFYDQHYDIDDGNSWEGAISANEDNGHFDSTYLDGVYPYKEMAGEVEAYRLEMKLNELGTSFLVVADYFIPTDNGNAS